MPENSEQQLPTTDRQWDALGLLRRLHGQGLTAGRGTPGLHLATLKPLEAMGLIDLAESGEPDRRGRQWTATLTEAGRHALDQDKPAEA